MDNQKESGSYYTPQKLVEFMVDYLKGKQQDFDSVLEPSAGDGRFLPLLLPCSNHVEAVELFKKKAMYIEQQCGCGKLNVECGDFIQYASGNKNKYSLVIGNPPYINLTKMDTAEIERAKRLCEDTGLSSTAMQNIWVAFVLASFCIAYGISTGTVC